MSFWFEDAKGNYLGEFNNLRFNWLADNAGPKVRQFLDTGIADAKDVAEMKKELTSTPIPDDKGEAKYLLKCLKTVKRTPIYVEDGIVS